MKKMNKLKHIRKKSIGILIVLLFLISIITPFIDLSKVKARKVSDEEEQSLNLSTNYLFKGTTYTFNLDDFYDDTYLYKIYTDAKFQTEAFNGTTLEWTGVINNDTVTPVDNDETQYGKSSEVYNGTHDFREFADGTEGYDITGFADYYSAGTNTSGKIISEMDDHKKILELKDESDVGSVKIRHNFDYTEVDSTIEFWLASNISDVGYRGLYVYFYDQDLVNTIVLLISGTVFRYYNGTSDYTLSTHTANELFHVKVVLDDTADTYDVYVDNDLKETDINYISASTSNAYRIYFATRTSNTGYKIYVDAVSYSADPDYTIGENLYPDNIIMMNGSYDYTDNMKVNDDSSTNFTSTHTDGYIHEMPSQWDDFTFTNGTGITIGELETIDANYSEIDCDFESSDTYGIMRPVGDISTGSWSKEGFTYFYENVDDNIEEPDAGDSVDIYTSTNGDSIYFDLTNIGYIIKSYVLWVRHRCSAGTEAVDLYMDYNDGGGYGYIGQEGATTSYTWDLRSVSSVNKLGNGWNLRIRAASPSPYTHFIDAVYLKVLYEGIDCSLDVQVDMQIDNPDLSSIGFLKYSHRTNVSVTMDLDIWNWDTSTWYEIESVDNSATFDDDFFTLGSGSDYVSETNQVRIRFQLNTGSNDFELQIDRLRLDYLTTSAELEFTITFTFANYNEDLLALTVQSWQKTNISQTINFSVWNFTSGAYVQISSSSDTSFTEKDYDTESPSDFISPTGTVRLYWVGSNTTNDFELHIDYLFIQIFYKLDLVHEKSFDTNGIYRYRWVVLGSIHYTQWVVFEVVDPEPNFHAISESESTTRWILQNATLISLEDFHDDINTDEWQLLEVSNKTFDYTTVITRDSYVDNVYPETNFGSSISLAVGLLYDYVDWHRLRAYFGFNNFDENYFFENQTGTNEIWFRITFQSGTGNYSLYNTTAFEEYDITWSNAPSFNSLKDTGTMPGTGWKYFTVSELEEYYMIKHQTEDYNKWLFVNSKESAYKPYAIRKNVSKNYFGNGYMYMQTDTTEAISLQSTAYGTNYTLSSGDYFEVDFQTNSDSQINLVLLKDGVVNKTLTLSQSGNSNFNRHTAQISIDEDVEFDQLKISSTFEDIDNVKVYDIKTKKYTITGDYKDFRVGSHQDYETYLTPDTYNLRINDPHDGDVKINTNITIGSGYNFYIYEPVKNILCRITLFSPEGDYLQFEDYHIKINRSLNGGYNQFDLVDTLFYADEETYVYIDVYDRFGTSINNFSRLASSYIDLEIEVYSLQIKNLQTQKTTVDINSTHVYPLLSGDSLYFMLSKNYYQIGYYDTNDVYKQFLIYLDSNQAYELNRSKICFLAFVNQKGEHLYFDNYKTYINDTLLYENVFYREIGDDIGIEVKDIYGISIKNQTYTVVSGDNYIPVVLTLYSLKVMNMQEQFNHINITRDPNYYESSYYWSEWVAPNEIVKFRLFPGYYKINLTDNEGGSYSYYSYTLSGDDILLISSDNVLSQVIYNIANVNTTIGNLITNVEINITNQNSEINNTIVNIEINLSNVNSTLGTLLTNIDLDIINLESDINSLYLFTNTSIWNLNNAMNTSFIYMENNIYSINQSISTLVIGIDNRVTLLNATIISMFTEMNQQFITVQSTLNYSFSFLNQSIIQLANDITDNHVILYNLIEQRANDIDSSLIDVQTLINLVNNTVADESLVIQTIINLIGANITSNHIIINNLLNLIDNNITNNNIQLVSILEIIGNNITTNHFVIQTLLDLIGNNITYNHIELLTNLNLINTTISQNQIELINRLLFINNTINDMMFELTNQLIFLNGTIYSAILNLSTSVEFGVDMVIGNITITYQQNEFLTELYKRTTFSQLLNWSGAAYNYTLMEDRIDIWTFVNNYINQSIEVHLRYQDLIEKLVISADDFRDQWLPDKDVEYNLWSVADGEYVDKWKELDPDNKTVDFGFYDEEVPEMPSFDNTSITITLIILIFIGVIGLSSYFVYKYNQRVQKLKRAYAMQHTVDKDLIKGAVRPRSSRMKRIK